MGTIRLDSDCSVAFAVKAIDLYARFTAIRDTLLQDGTMGSA